MALLLGLTTVVAGPGGAEAAALPPDYGSPIVIAMGYDPSTAEVLDVDADGHLDIVVLNVVTGTVSVVLGDGVGGFATPVDHAVGGFGADLNVEDMNGDGIIDLIVPIREPAGSRGIAIMAGDGVGGFSSPSLIPAGPRPHFVDVADLDGDGFKDLVITHCCGSSDANFFMQVLFGGAGGTFSSPVTYPTGGGLGFRPVVDDLDDDGDVDIVVSLVYTGLVAIWANDGSGVFPATPQYLSLGNQSVELADLDDDGHEDLVVTNLASSDVAVLTNTSTPGAISFTSPVLIPTVAGTLDGFVGDMNGDGLDDVVVSHQSTGQISIILAAGGGTPTVAGPFDALPAPNHGSAGDLNGDGKQDIVVTSQTPTGSLVILLNDAVPPPCGATTPFVVDELTDDDGSATPNSCSLREAVLAANGYSGPGTPEIVLGPGTHQLSIGGRGEEGALTGDLDITAPVSIVAAAGPLAQDATTVAVDGGGVDRVFDVHSGGSLQIEGVTITGGDGGPASNGGGILVSGSLELRRSVVDGNTATGGGGLFFGPGSDASVTDSAIVNNIATDDGGGLESTAGRGSDCPTDHATCPTRLINVTVSGNTALVNNGGVSFDNNSDGYLNNVTITANDAGGDTGGLGPGTGGRVYVANTAIGGNAAQVSRDDCDLGVWSLDHNFFETGCDAFVALVGSGLGPNDVVGSDPDVGPLGLNGGTTSNHVPNSSSPLIDEGSSGAGVACGPLDQRGSARIGPCDIGSIEGVPTDTTPPTVTIVSPADGSVVEIGSVVAADFSCGDGGSGVVSCVGDVADGAPIDTGSLGVFTFSVTGTDGAGNSTGVTHSYEVVDTVAPTVTLSTPADGVGYEVGSTVAADFSCGDGGSGVVSCVGDVADGAPIDTGTLGSFTFTVAATDGAGNSTTVTHSYDVVDTAPPTVTIVSPADGSVVELGSIVTADFSCADGGSGIASCVGDVADGDPIDTGSLGVFTFAVTGTDAAGNVTNVIHGYDVVDSVAPTVTLSTPADGAGYEVGSTVAADFSCGDTGSGIASCVGDVADGDPIDTGSTGAFTFAVTATDGAGNSTTVTHSYDVVDTGDPTITLSTPADGADYEIGTLVAADYACNDVSMIVTSCVGDVTDGDPIDTGSLGVFTFTVTATDAAGNSTSVTHSYEVVDTVAPTVTLSTPADGVGYEVGSVVAADFSCGDAGSGIASCVGDVTDGDPIDTSTLGVFTFTVTGTDAAGNSTSVTHSYEVVDTVAPTVTLSTPADGAGYEVGSVVAADFSCADGGSGIVSCVGDVADGDPIDTGSTGAFSFTVTATDAAGNSTTVTHSFDVVDTGDPTITLSTPADGADYEVGSTVAADFSCADGGSGIVSCVGDVADGDPIDTSSTGVFTFTVTATDAAGNTTSVTHDYNIIDGPKTATDLIDRIESYGLPHGFENALLVKAGNIEDRLADGDINGALNSLNALHNQVQAQSGKKLTAEQADELLTCIDDIIDQLNTGP